MFVAVLGAGKAGSVHARALARVGGEVQIGVADSDPARARRLAIEVGGRAVAMDEAINRADALVIATPPSTHTAFVLAAVQRRCPALCEKPLADDVDAAIRLAEIVVDADVPLQIGFQRRFDPAYLAAREAVRLGEIGRLQLMRFTGTEPGLAPSPKTNLFRNTAIHDFDLVRWLSDEEVESIYAEGADRTSGRVPAGHDPDTIVSTLRLESGALASVTTTRLSPIGYDARVELVGNGDHVVAGWTPRTPIRPLDAGAVAPSDPWREWQERFAVAFERQMSAFLAAARGGKMQGATVLDGVEAQRLAEAARRSHEEGRRIDVIRVKPIARPGAG